MTQLRIFGGMGAIVLPLLAAGCASGQASPGPRLEVVKGPTLDNRVRILWIEAHEKADQVVIHGAVRRQSHTNYPIQTHVDVVVIGADGRPLQRSWSQDIFVARRGPGKGPDWTGFDMTLPARLPEGSTIEAVCHSGRHQAGATANSLKNPMIADDIRAADSRSLAVR